MATKKKTKKAKSGIILPAGSRRVSKRRSRPHDRNVISPTARAAKKAQEAAVWFSANPTVRTPVEKVVGDRDFTVIENVASFRNPIGAVAVMERKAGNVAAEHRHEREGHVCYLVSGAAIYRERRGGELIEHVMIPGRAIFSPPNVPHAFLFTLDGVMVVVANISRAKAEYEADLYRLSDSEKLFAQSEIDAATAPRPSVEGAPV